MTAPLTGNDISIEFPAGELQEILAAIKALQEKLQPRLVDLDAETRRTLSKMGPRTVDFVTKTLAYTRANPQFKPAFVDLDEYERDLAAVTTLRQLAQPLSLLADMVDDSLMLSGSEAYAAALACYQAIKSAARLKQPGAEVIFADLGTRFAARPAKAGGTAVPPGDGTSPPIVVR